jgi:thiol-disulfide isomerase/thioredoxin
MNQRQWLPWACLAVLVAAACGQAGSTAPKAGNSTPQPQESAVVRANLRDYGAAPELQNTVWLNTAAPLHLADLRGQVVLLDMWTFDCINCQHVIPSLRTWYDTYHGQGLVVIGNHFPEFPYEADLGNLKNAVKRLDVRYPVAQDNNGQTWAAYHTQYWPTLFLIDKRGHIRYQQIGEGAYPETESAIQSLLAESYS